jgi:cyclohexa-1,5-dienecarbonyl-CoA hydratase
MAELPSSARIETSFDGEVAYVTLNHPPVNVIDFETISEILLFIESLTNESRLCCVVLQGAGHVFSGGVDVAAHLPDTAQRMISEFHRVFEYLDDLAAPTVAVVRGPCMGGACELAGYMDVVIATENAEFALPEIKLGVFPPVAAALFPQRFRFQGAMQMLLTGETINATEAVRAGLVSHLVPEEQLQQVLDELLRSFRSKSASSLRVAKRAVLQARGSFRSLVEPSERVYLGELMATADAVEGLQAFVEKREPIWGHA